MARWGENSPDPINNRLLLNLFLAEHWLDHFDIREQVFDDEVEEKFHLLYIVLRRLLSASFLQTETVQVRKDANSWVCLRLLRGKACEKRLALRRAKRGAFLMD